MNILPVWKRGITGKGVVVSILDDGKESLFCFSSLDFRRPTFRLTLAQFCQCNDLF